jgi:Zn-dependent protease with chaperone function
MHRPSTERAAPPGTWQLLLWVPFVLLLMALGDTALFAVLAAAPAFWGEDWSLLVCAAGPAALLLATLGSSLAEARRLHRGGGGRIARWAGGRLLDEPALAREQRLLAIVDDIASRADLPRPEVYLLEREDMINSFVCGWNNVDVCMVVTRGALERLQPDELKGVVAHEFGHIRWRDMRAHMMQAPVVWGLLRLHHWGRSLLTPGDDGARVNLLSALVGSLLLILGMPGRFAALLLHNRMARQRALRADVYAVKFTRSRDGLGNALRKVWFQSRHAADANQRRLRHAPADLLAPMLLHHAPALAWLPTHPSPSERVRRIFGRERSPLSANLVVPTATDLQQNGRGAAGTPRTATSNGHGKPASSAGSLHTGNTPPQAARTAPAVAPAAGPTHQPVTPPASARPTPIQPAPAPRAPAETPGPAVARQPVAMPPTPAAAPADLPLLDIEIPLADDHPAPVPASQWHGPEEQRAALLACFLIPGQSADEALWRRLTHVPQASAILRAVYSLSAADRSDTFETLLRRYAAHSSHERRALAEGTQLLTRQQGRRQWARNRLRWQVIRHVLHPEPTASDPASPSARGATLDELNPRQLMYVATFTAFLAHLIPGPTPTGEIGAGGEDWYYAVMGRCVGDRRAMTLPPDVSSFGRTQWDLEEAIDTPELAGLDRALWGLQELSVSARQQLLRVWVDEACDREPDTLGDEAAATLRLAAALLDAKLPPALAPQRELTP